MVRFGGGYEHPMKLFDDIQRDDSAPPPNSRREFAFLNRTCLPLPTAIRTLFEEAFTHYTGDRNAIRARFRSDDNAVHLSAAFELFLHEFMRRRGLGPIANARLGGGKVDLQISLKDGTAAFIEATMLDPAQNVHYAVACDAIDGIKRANVRLDLRIVRAPTQAIQSKRLVRELNAYLDASDHDPASCPSSNILEQKRWRLNGGSGSSLVSV
jgi:hypothetical protein